MTDDLRTAIDRELPPGSVPFASLDVEAAVAAGRAARRRRRVAAGGAVLSMTAGAAALVVMLPLGTAGAPPADRTPSAASEAPVATTPSGPQPPQLDPTAAYYWATDLEAEQTEGTRAYTEAFWDFFAEQYPGAELTDMGESQLGPPAESGWFERRLFWLNRGEFDENHAPIGEHEEGLFERTTYGLTYLVDAGLPTEGHTDALTIRFEGRGDIMDSIDVEVLPAGSYHREIGPLHPSGCFPDNDLGWNTCELEHATGPDGEDLEYVTAKVQDDGGPLVETAYLAVLYRPDGSAVMVSDDANRLSPDDPMPYLSFEALAAIAAALPDLPVR